MVLKESIVIDNPTSLILSPDQINQFDCTPLDFEPARSDSNQAYTDNYRQMNKHLQASFQQNDQGSVTYVMCGAGSGSVIGYYTIAMGVTKLSKKFRQSSQIEGQDGNTGYPCVDVPFLAVNRAFQRSGYGKLLLEHLLLNVYWQIVPIIGADLIRLDAIDRAKDFYSRYGFLPYTQAHQRKRLIPVGLATSIIPDVLRFSTATQVEKDIQKMLESTLVVFQRFLD